MTVSYSPTRRTRSVLVHTGALTGNAASSMDDARIGEFERSVDSGTVPIITPLDTSLSYVPPDAGILASASYDELMVDLQPVVTSSASVGSISAATQETLRGIALSDRPYWIVVRCDGYAQYATRTSALQCALAVVSWASETVLGLLMSTRLQGFAFVSPDLNVLFSDGTTIDRLFQNQLVQQCWSRGVGAAFLTSRPADATCLVGPRLPVLPRNTNSGQPLPWPVLGTNPSCRDRLVMRYPWPSSQNQSPALLLGMLGGMLGTRGRDPGFPLNMDYAFVTPVDEQIYRPDGVMGTNDAIDWSERVHAFVAATGITTLGLDTRQVILPPERYLPSDDRVNVSGSFRASSTDGITTIQYPDATGATVTRTFDDQFVELGSAAG